MGWISDLLGFGDDNDTRGNTSTVIQRTDIPEYVTEFSKEQLNFARDLATTPFAPAPGELVAPFSDDQMDAFDAARRNQGIADPYFDAANTGYTGVAESDFRNADIAGYMNPYLGPMEDTINRGFDIAQTQQDANAVKAGAFGNDRRGIVDAELGGQRSRALGDLRRQAYDKAETAYRDDQEARLRGAGALQSLGTEVQAAAGRDAGQLALYGGQQQGHGQAMADSNYNQFLREYEHPFQMFNVRQSALSGLPYSTTTARDTTQASGNTTAQNLGALANIVGGVGNFFAKPGGGGESAATGVSNAFDSFSNFFSGS